MNGTNLNDATAPRSVDQQQACSPFPWEPIPDWMFGKSVEARNALQNCGRVHPYTCGNNDCRKATNQAPLRAVENGWVCDHCGYTQPLTANADVTTSDDQNSKDTTEADSVAGVSCAQRTGSDDYSPLFLWMAKNNPNGYCARFKRWVEAGKPEAGFAATLPPICR